ncbi:glycosyltransferase [Endozoicomonas gorgoniicola]|uniref:Glycosyltransferase n=1 Tax=Endozoicomonas gorgoniicola TaxID=1234144 RepID=A0ABT3MSS7_9GAMM|nr:glycosyltransferase [Endozoicomonas gorgoniicola]MCW7552413.1 glycosyltransferase [Endozoicomonas gorgoniicola]
MKTSILMSLYAKEKPEYLNECLKSLHNQTLKADEIVVVYDGPLSYQLKAIVEVWSVKLPIKVVVLEKNVGLGNALQIGLKHCHYNLIARMDADDICKPFRLERQVDCFLKDSKLTCLGSWINEFDDSVENITSVKKVPLDYTDIVRFSKYRNPMNHMTVMFKKDAVLKSGGYKHLHFMEDYYLWLRMIAKGYKFMNLQEVLVDARTGRGMLERRGGIQYLKSEIELSRYKFELKISSALEAYSSLMLRSTSRVLGVSGRRRIYKFIRSR